MKISTSKIQSNKIFCLVGPSGTGKSVIAESIPLPQVVSYRTREPRAGEVDGLHGHFISKEKFLEMKKQDLWIAETLYSGNYYGITQGELLELEQAPMVYVVDWDGVVTLKYALSHLIGYDPEQVVSIFIHTPREDLETRMLKQGRDKTEIKARLDRADRDYAVNQNCDYVIQNLNGMFDTTLCEIMKVIIKEGYR